MLRTPSAWTCPRSGRRPAPPTGQATTASQVTTLSELGSIWVVEHLAPDRVPEYDASGKGGSRWRGPLVARGGPPRGPPSAPGTPPEHGALILATQASRSSSSSCSDRSLVQGKQPGKQQPALGFWSPDPNLEEEFKCRMNVG